MAICIRFVDKDLRPVEAFVGLYASGQTTGQAIATMLTDVCLRSNLDIQHLRDQTYVYDSAANTRMSGAYKGAQAYIFEKQPLAHFFHSTTLCLNLVCKSVAFVLDIHDALSVVHEIGCLACNTIKFRRAAADTEGCLGKLRLLQDVCPTRWTVRAMAIKNIIDNYGQVLESLSNFIEGNT